MHDPVGDQLRALIQNENTIHVFLVVFALLDFLTKIIFHTQRRSPALDVLVDINAHDLIRCKESVFDAPL